MYNSSVVTDQKPQDVAMALVRECLLDLLTDELPYSIKTSIQQWDIDQTGIVFHFFFHQTVFNSLLWPGNLNIVMVLDCQKAFTARLVVGTSGRTVLLIARETEQKLRNLFRCEVRLRLVVKPDQRLNES